ncbi:transcriptional regulator [Pseudomonas protegens]|uniref:TraR/DksA C4-type zinc finger protein n=1 Tax=Pseudomonas TaxID=286 RepID=UPI000C9BE48D|nr:MULTISPECIES: TraR/DksA C4-type zinc finger protein [Pseudomonas]MBW8356688.1 TraR/DksA C4-type zinc finger protein [Pseudomonas sp.]PNG40250.1 transcriptional regulator [Pseudomonas protegens]
MADVIDIANDQADYFLQVALDRRQRQATTAASAEFCEDCDDPIPLPRQQMVRGCQTCVSCQELREARR